MTYEERVIAEIKREYNNLDQQYNLVYLGLYGSQNYNLHTEQSDVDLKAIVLPSFDDFVANRKPISKTIQTESGGQCDVKDIRLMFDCFKKQNVNFIELLFTKYYLINQEYHKEFMPMIRNNEKIARYNQVASINCMVGMAYEKRKALCHPYAGIKDKIDKWGFDCYSEDTLFLTDSGWKNYYDITDVDKLATMNQETFGLEYQHFNNRIKKQTDSPLYTIEGFQTKFCVTENHKLFCSHVKVNQDGLGYKSEKSNWTLQSLQARLNKRGKHEHMISFPKNCNEEYPIDDKWLLLCGLYISDGTMTFRDKLRINVKTLRLTQNKEHRYLFHKVADMLVNYYGGNTWYDIKKNDCLWNFNKEISQNIFDECGHLSKIKRLPKFYTQLSQRQCKILLYALMLGDGTFQKSRDVYYTSNYKLAQDVITLGLLSGKFSVLMGGEDGFFYDMQNKVIKGKPVIDIPMYQVSVKKKHLKPVHMCLTTGINGCIKEINMDTKQLVVCFDVPNGLLVTMKDGKPAVQGNSKQIHHIFRLHETMLKYMDDIPYSDCLISSIGGFLKEIKVNNEYFDVDEAKNYADVICDIMSQRKEKYFTENELFIDTRVEEIMHEVTLNIFKKSFREEIINE